MTIRTQERPSVWNRVVRAARKEGLPGLIRRAADYRAKFRLMRSVLITTYLNPNAPIPESGGDLVVKRIGPEDRETIAEMVRMYRVPADEQGILRRMANDELCYVGWVNGRVVSYFWVYIGKTVKEYNERLFDLAPDEVYFHDAYVLPEMRGRSVFTIMQIIASSELVHGFGRKRAVSFIRWDNYASMNASRKLGAVRVGRIGYVMLFGRRFRYLIRERERPL